MQRHRLQSKFTYVRSCKNLANPRRPPDIFRWHIDRGGTILTGYFELKMLGDVIQAKLRELGILKLRTKRTSWWIATK